MHIKELVIDGFKSYAKRTVIKGWDREFNAITGLNGSGKSNILDAICFVLGISNLGQVRASSLRDLVYKQGQGNVNRASVSIIFDNSEKSASPVGYEQYDTITVTREIVIGGRNKYMINGHTAQLNRVQNLFHSVQLNVNNPHFLIMQGRITKVLNMKPPEILGMIEEAAGTKMFQLKKESALKTIEKKQHKVHEIDKILADDITPQLEKLRSETQKYMKWTTNNSEIERLTRFCIAFDYYSAQMVVDEGESAKTSVVKEIKLCEDRVKSYDDDLNKLRQTVNDLQASKLGNMDHGLDSFEQEVEQLAKEYVRREALFQSKSKSIKEDAKGALKSEKAIEKMENQLKSLKEDLLVEQKRLQELQKSEAELESRKNGLESQLLGFDVTQNGKDKKGSLIQQQMDADRKITEIDSQIAASQLKIKHWKKSLADRKKVLKNISQDSGDFSSDQDLLLKSQKRLQKEIQSFSFNELELDVLQKDIEKNAKVMSSVQEQLDVLKASVSRMDFQWNKSGKVYGRVAKLINIPNADHTTALEVCAGGKLFHVVVDTEETAKKILRDTKSLKYRVTIIPLNKIKGRKVSDEKLSDAASLVGAENVHTAISLTEFPKEIEAAIGFVFGSSFVCKDAKTANTVTFHRDIRVRSVSLQGDLFDPSGTLTGGSRGKSSVLSKLVKYNELERERQGLEMVMKELLDQRNKILTAKEQFEQKTSELDLVNHKLQLFEDSMKHTLVYKAQQDVQEAEQCLSSVTEDLEEGLQAKEAAILALEEISRSINDQDSVKSKDSIIATIESIKKELVGISKSTKAVQKQVEGKLIKIDACERDISTEYQSFKGIQNKLEILKADLANEKLGVDGIEQEHRDAKSALEAKKSKLLEASEEINDLKSKMDRLASEKNKVVLTIKRHQFEVEKYAERLQESRDMVSSLSAEHSWIGHELKYFGKAKSDYDFENIDINLARKRLQKFKKDQDQLSKTLNKKAMGMKERAEEEYQQLMKRRDIIMNDKAKIEEVIDELDLKKNEALENTWVKVNKDFGSIFSSLLPGTQAKLEPPAGGSVLDGLEVKVAFGDVWKESLSELSGGQRSLLALSLILSLLLFKPAPMYILDEIDAALDLSHTQNIGRMLKAHFSQSQFIIVSLKEGMFNNANVLFSTKFVDGVSTVSWAAKKA